MPPARSRSSSSVAVLAAATLLLSTGCAARFARNDTAAQAAEANGGLPVAQGTAAPVPGAPGGPAGPVLNGGQPLTGSSAGPGGALTGTRSRTSTSTTTVQQTAGPQGTTEVAPGSTAGISGSTIKIGLFVPKTGAAPVPPTIDAQAQNYFDYVKQKGGIWGRNVKVTVYDTQSTEAGARAAVQQALSDGVFAAVTLDRISVEGALVTALHNAGVPQLVSQMPAKQAIPDDAFYIGTDQVHNGQQIADYMAHTLKLKRVGFVGENDPTAYPARDAFVARAKADGMQVVHNDVVDGMGNQFLSEAQKLKNDNAQSVWMYVAPNNAINISKETDSIGYHPVWIGSSISWGFNLVLSPAAGALDGAHVFSPWGGLSDPRYRTFNQVDTQGRTAQDKDIGLGAWGFGQVVAAALKAVGPKLGRNSFRVAMQSLRTGAVDAVTGAPMCWPPLDFSGGKRYGSGDRTVVMKVQGSGASAVWATESDYRSVY